MAVIILIKKYRVDNSYVVGAVICDVRDVHGVYIIPSKRRVRRIRV